jgi:hypothetical protein
MNKQKKKEILFFFNIHFGIFSPRFLTTITSIEKRFLLITFIYPNWKKKIKVKCTYLKIEYHYLKLYSKARKKNELEI